LDEETAECGGRVRKRIRPIAEEQQGRRRGDLVTDPTPSGTVLILVRDVLGTALFAMLVEGLGKRPLFAFGGERAERAVARVRPAIVLLECHHPAARSDAFFALAADAQSRVVLFAPSAPWDDVAEIARRPEVSAFVHPRPGRSLADLLRDALSA
jgi:hypothetical protein